MRITLDIDDDVLRAVMELARRERKTVGEVISELACKALAASVSHTESKPPHGFRPFPSRGAIVTNELIDRLREKDVY
jgi:hypothetical protein